MQGIYRLHLNGCPVGDSYFTPGWTDYARRLYFNAWDVTTLLQPGANAVGAVVADGWYAGASARSGFAWTSRETLFCSSLSPVTHAAYVSSRNHAVDTHLIRVRLRQGRCSERQSIDHAPKLQTDYFSNVVAAVDDHVLIRSPPYRKSAARVFNMGTVMSCAVHGAGYIGFGGQRNHYGRRRALRLQLEVETEDGGRSTACATDDGWRWTDGGPIREADFLMGETYDARR